MNRTDMPQGTFSELVKRQVFFTLATDDRVFVGDLYYDFALREFQFRGIPAYNGKMRHIFEAEFRGPVTIDMYVKQVIEWAPREKGDYADLRFRSAKVTGSLGAHLEEWHGDRTVMQAVDEFWESTTNLTWYK